MENNSLPAILALSTQHLAQRNASLSQFYTSFALLFSLLPKGEVSHCGDLVREKGSENLLVTQGQMHILFRSCNSQTKAKTDA